MMHVDVSRDLSHFGGTQQLAISILFSQVDQESVVLALLRDKSHLNWPQGMGRGACLNHAKGQGIFDLRLSWIL